LQQVALYPEPARPHYLVGSTCSSKSGPASGWR
jgi:hypothetical protein